MKLSPWKPFALATCVLLASLSSVLHAAGEEQKIRDAILLAVPGTKIVSIKPSPMAGIFEVEMATSVVYASADGQYILQGDLIQLKGKQAVSLTEQANAAKRVSLLAGIDRRDQIIFPAKGKAKGVLTVFTDIDCGYCRKLHQEVPAMNKLGIEVRYMAFPRDLPRTGPNAGVSQRMNQVWCSTDREHALTQAKQGDDAPPARANCKSPVAAQFALGQRLGVRGTPAIFTNKGEMIGGFLTAADAAKALGIN